MNKYIYFKKISDFYGLDDQLKFQNVFKKINFLFKNMSIFLKLFFSIYFFALRVFSIFLNTKKIINFLNKNLIFKLFHEFCIKIFLMFYYDDA